MSVIGPSIFQPEQCILALGGLGHSATCLQIHPSSISTIVEETPCPSWASLNGASNSTEVLAKVAPVDTQTKIKSCCMIIIPPLVALPILSPPFSPAKDLIPIIDGRRLHPIESLMDSKPTRILYQVHSPKTRYYTSHTPNYYQYWHRSSDESLLRHYQDTNNHEGGIW